MLTTKLPRGALRAITLAAGATTLQRSPDVATGSTDIYSTFDELKTAPTPPTHHPQQIETEKMLLSDQLAQAQQSAATNKKHASHPRTFRPYRVAPNTQPKQELCD